MHFGFLTVHPITVPFGNELAYSISSIINHGVVLYSGVLQPEISQLKEIIQLL